MQKKNYVISVKRVKEYMGASIPEDKQYFEYAGFDRHSGAMSSGYPVFSIEQHAEKFETEEDAKAWWERNKNALYQTTNMDRYDINTLAVRKVSYRKVLPLKL